MPSAGAPRRLVREVGAFGFDLDGTLVDSTGAIAMAVAAAASALSIDLGHVNAEYLATLSLGDYREALDFASAAQFARFQAAFIEGFDSEFFRLVKVQPGAMEVVSRLRERLGEQSVFILTNRREASAKQILEHLGFPPLPDRLWSSGGRGSASDNRKGVLLKDILDSIYPGVTVAYVGDAASDLEAARYAGAVPIFVGREHGLATSPVSERVATVRLTGIRELLHFIS